MKIQVSDIEENPYQNFLNSFRDAQTRSKYNNDLKTFLNLIPNSVFEHYLHYEPKSRNTNDLAHALIELTKIDVKNAKSIIRAYVQQIKKDIEEEKIGSGRAKNKLKPIKKLFKSNDVDISWSQVDNSMPHTSKSKDRAYTRNEIQQMLKVAANLTDRVIILLFSCAGFRVEAWNYFTWQDVIFFDNADGSFAGGALLVYRGDVEEYWTHITPETCDILSLYKKDWNQRFGRYPNNDDPLLASIRFDRPTRLHQKGVATRVVNILEKINLRPKLKLGQKRHEIMPDHGFRKFFNTMLRRAKVYWPDKEDMMGHQVHQENSYERYVAEDFEWFPEYQKAIPFLTISSEERQKLELAAERKKKDDLQEANAELSKQNAELSKQNAEIDKLKQRQRELEESWFRSNFTRFSRA